MRTNSTAASASPCQLSLMTIPVGHSYTMGRPVYCDVASLWAPRNVQPVTSTPEALWRPWFVRELSGERTIIGHGDLGPWNILARNGRPVAFIDWDNAGPVDPLWELAHVVWQNAQLYDDDVTERNQLPDETQRVAQAKLILDGYEMPRAKREGIVDRLIKLAVWSAREEAVEHEVVSESPSPTPKDYPILRAVTWRIRSAAWMLDHHDMLRSVLES